MSYVITPPISAPITLEDIEAHLRISITEEYDLVELYISAITARAEVALNRALITQTREMTLDSFPIATRSNPFAAIALPLPPLQSVVSVGYLNTANILTTLDPSMYVVDTKATPGTIKPAYGQIWPSTLGYPGAVKIRFIAGYGDSPTDIPGCVRSWMLVNLGTMYEHRETVTIGSGGVISMETIVDGLLAPEIWNVRV